MGRCSMGIDTSKLWDLSEKIFSVFQGKDEKDILDDDIFIEPKIQSKYFSTGAKCIQDCFDGDRYKYYKSDGLPMQIEVPADKYDDAVNFMQSCIDGGKIHGVQRAEDIVRAGIVTYEQAKNLALAGNIAALTYDAGNIRIANFAGGISAAVTFAVSTWNGNNFEDALADSIKISFHTGGISLTNVQAANLKKLSGVGKSGGSLYDTAAETLATKFFRGNVVTGIATTIAVSAGDIVNIFRGRISTAQLFKNVVNNGAGVAGGIGGAIYGAAAGSVVPVVGTFIGGVVGGFIGSSAAEKISHTVTDKFIEDDSKAMIQILEDEFKIVAVDFLLSKDEVKKVVKRLSKKLDGGKIRDMYASDNRNEFARNLLKEFIFPVVKSRKKIYLPSNQMYVNGLNNILTQ